MIIFGTRGVQRRRDGGEFHCPDCQAARTYSLKEVRRFFTLYFIPLIPLDSRGSFVECDACGAAFTPDVLAWNPNEDNDLFLAAYCNAVKRVMVLMMLADGEIDADEVLAIRKIYDSLTGHSLSVDEVDAEVHASRTDGLGIRDYLPPLLGTLNDQGKERILLAAHHVAMADGAYPPEEQQLVLSIGQVLEMSPAHVRGVLAASPSV